MDAERKFKEEIEYYLEDNTKCQGIIFPTKFGLNSKMINYTITKTGNISINKVEQIFRDYVNTSVRVWEILRGERSLIIYKLIAYISESMKFNTNVITLNKQLFDGYNARTVSARDYNTALIHLKDKGVISSINNIQGKFIVNPYYLFKGNIYIYKELCDKYQMFSSTTDEKGRVIVDKALIIKDIKEKEVELIINKKYIKPNKVEKEEKIKELPKLKLKMI